MSGQLVKQGQKPSTKTNRSFRILPGTKTGWWALGLAVIGIAAWVLLPIITITFRERYPVTDTWVMPAIGTVLIDIAAVFNLLCLWPWRDRSMLNIAATALVVPVAILFTLIVVGELVSGA